MPPLTLSLLTLHYADADAADIIFIISPMPLPYASLFIDTYADDITPYADIAARCHIITPLRYYAYFAMPLSIIICRQKIIFIHY